MEEVGLSPFQNQHSPAVGVSPLDPNVDYYGCGSGLVPYTQSDSSGEDSEGQCDISFQLDDGDNGVFEDEEEDEEQHDTQEEEAEVDVTTYDEGDEQASMSGKILGIQKAVSTINRWCNETAPPG